MGNDIHQNFEETHQTIKKSHLKHSFRGLYIAGVLLLLLVTTFFLVYIFYIKKVNIYEPVAISIPGLTWQELNVIDTYCITPLDRKIKLQFISDCDIAWQTGYGFISAFEMGIPDSLLKKVKSIDVNILKLKFSVRLNTLKLIGLMNGKPLYILPAYIRNETSFLKLIVSLVHWQDLLPYLLIILTIVVFVLLLTFDNKLEKVVFNFKKIFSYNKAINRENGQSKKIYFYRKTLYTWIITFFVSVFLACTLFFGYLYFKFTLVNFVTAILSIIWFGLVFMFFLGVVSEFFKFNVSNFQRKFLIFIFLWICLESLLRVLGVGKGYNEELGFYYASGFVEHNKSDKQSKGLWVHPRYEVSLDKKKEFSYVIKCNGEGLRDIDHNIKKDSSEYRIICMGNSFTEGIGAPQDSTWPRQLENILSLKSKKKITVFNAGNSGADVFFEYKLLEKRMLKYIIILNSQLS